MNDVVTIDPAEVSVSKFHGYMLGAVAPRPIAFASTIDEDGHINLSPFSFFNAFSANPPILIFSPARRVRDNSTKHTLENVREVPEVVINVVSHGFVEQMSLSSTEYEKGINEFIKSGLTMVESDRVRPPRVGESPAAFECKVNEVIPLGEGGGAGNLVICQVVLAHFSATILDQNGRVDPHKLDAIGRLGDNWYTRASGNSLFEIAKPVSSTGVGVDSIPNAVRDSEVLTANDLGRLGNVEYIPPEAEVEEFGQEEEIRQLIDRFRNDMASLRYQLHQKAKYYISEGEILKAWKVLLQPLPSNSGAS